MTLRALNREDAGPVPQEALDYFEAKEIRPGFSHLDVWGEEHTRAFTAAKFMREDVLAAMQTSLATALREGQTYEMWARGLQPELERLGFWGRQLVTDPLTGQVTEISVPHRLEHIFRQNMRTARAAGQWERIQRTKASHPYLLYLLGPSERHRPLHVTWHGILLPVDDPFWQTHFAPNGHGCKCSIRQVTSREADRLERDGIRSGVRTPILDEQGLPTGRHLRETTPVRRTAPPIVLVPFENKRTGVIEMVPEGIDPGFAHPPSQLRVFQGGPNRPPVPPATPPAPRPAQPATPATPTPAAPSALPPDEFADVRAQVFAGQESVPRRMLPAEVGQLLGESMAAGDGGHLTRRLGRALVRSHVGDMLRTGASEGTASDELLFKRLRPGVDGMHATPSGRITLRPSYRKALVQAATRLAAGETLTGPQAEALHTLVHETIHGFAFADLDDAIRLMGDSRPGRGVEEVVTEVLARQVMRETFGVGHGLPDLLTGDDPMPYYSEAIHRTMLAVDTVGTHLDIFPDEPHVARQERVQRMLETAALAMRRRGPLELAGAPAPPPPRNGFVWAYVDSVPFEGNADQVRLARRAMYRAIAKTDYFKGAV